MISPLKVSCIQVDQKLLFYNLGTWFQNVYGNNPMELVRMVKKVLSVEQMIIQNANQSQTGLNNLLNNQFCKIFEANLILSG